jgi:hypothetical protein
MIAFTIIRPHRISGGRWTRDRTKALAGNEQTGPSDLPLQPCRAPRAHHGIPDPREHEGVGVGSQQEMAGTADVVEGAMAFAQKRTPEFRGV